MLRCKALCSAWALLGNAWGKDLSKTIGERLFKYLFRSKGNRCCYDELDELVSMLFLASDIHELTSFSTKFCEVGARVPILQMRNQSPRQVKLLVQVKPAWTGRTGTEPSMGPSPVYLLLPP